MNITRQQMTRLRPLITAADKKNIAIHTDKSERTIQAVLQSDRTNDEIERAIVKAAKQNIADLSRLIADIEAKNISRIDLETFSKTKQSPAWTAHLAYTRSMDVYLQLSHQNFKEPAELWHEILNNYPDLAATPFYITDLLQRIIGLSDSQAVEFYNSSVII